MLLVYIRDLLVKFFKLTVCRSFSAPEYFPRVSPSVLSCRCACLPMSSKLLPASSPLSNFKLEALTEGHRGPSLKSQTLTTTWLCSSQGILYNDGPFKTASHHPFVQLSIAVKLSVIAISVLQCDLLPFSHTAF